MLTKQLPGAESSGSPVFVLTASRSGSTLLRFILDSHPELACPPETGVSVALAGLSRVWGILDGSGAGQAPGVPSPRAVTAMRAAIDDAFRGYLAARGKRRWCDKSLEAYQFTDLLLHVYPDAKFIVLTRHCMDVIASGVEMCPWGLSRFGFESFAAQYPGNSVAAIGSYWLACTQANVSFAEQHPDSCRVVRYEDLVTAPEVTAAAILSFLGAAPAPGITKTAFATPHDCDGPGDEKIWFTSEVSGDSVGRGVKVPAAALPPPVRQMINETLARLGYRTVEDDWNTASGPVDPRADRPPVPRRPAAEAPGDVRHRADAAVRMAAQAIAKRIAGRNQADLDAIATRWPVVEGTTLRIMVQGADGDHQEIRWHFGAPGSAAGRRVEAAGAGVKVHAIIAAPSTWQSLLDGRSNVVTEMTASRLRYVNGQDTHRLRTDEVHATAALLGLATIPVRTPARPEAAAVPATAR